MTTDLLLMRSALREALRPRRLLIAALLTLLPPAIGLAWRLLAGGKDFDPGDVYDSLTVGLVFSFSLTILSVVYGTGVVSQELEQRTIVYLLTRPLPRWRILLAKFIVSLGVVTAVTALSALLLALVVFGPSGFAQAGVGQDVRALLVGALAYGSVFLFLGAAFPRPLTWGLLLVFGWETWVPRLPGAFAHLSIMTYLRALAAREVTADAETAAAQASDNFLLAFSRPSEIVISTQSALTVLLTVAAVATLASIIVFSNRQYLPREDAE